MLTVDKSAGANYIVDKNITPLFLQSGSLGDLIFVRCEIWRYGA